MNEQINDNGMQPSAINLFQSQKRKTNQINTFQAHANETQNRSLYVKNLPTFMTDDQLRERLIQIYGKFGSLLSITVKQDLNLKRPYAFINYETYEDAEHALRVTNNRDILSNGMRLFVSWAERKSDIVQRMNQLQQANHGLPNLTVFPKHTINSNQPIDLLPYSNHNHNHLDFH